MLIALLALFYILVGLTHLMLIFSNLYNLQVYSIYYSTVLLLQRCQYKPHPTTQKFSSPLLLNISSTVKLIKQLTGERRPPNSAHSADHVLDQQSTHRLTQWTDHMNDPRDCPRSRRALPLLHATGPSVCITLRMPASQPLI
ncbi:hypothetical protein BDW69DRAFT_1056 [Aspergillus filifer]